MSVARPKRPREPIRRKTPSMIINIARIVTPRGRLRAGG
jgi:hypothetical protein